MAHYRSHTGLHRPASQIDRAKFVASRLCWTLAVCVVLLWVLTGCSGLGADRREQAALQLDFAAGLPSGWEAVDGFREVSIDGDAGIEYLLFFSFDVGQIGAVIYDGQRNGAGIQGSVGDAVSSEARQAGGDSATQADSPGEMGAVDAGAAREAVPTGTPIQGSGVPSQGFGYYRPYRLLPSYWSFSYGSDPGHGIIAPPDAADAVEVVTVPWGEGEQTLDAPAELLILGSNSHLTFVWWKGPVEGYGVTQLVAYGGFAGIDWADWAAKPTPIMSISGFEPILDYRARSQICRQVDYTRQTTGVPNLDDDGGAAPSVTVDGDIVFDVEDRGLRFCAETIPSYPFYPEGVVLAYLQRPPGGDRTLERLVAPGITTAQIDADGALDRLTRERVDDIATYRTIPVPPGGMQTGEFAPTTSVCVALTERESPSIQRWLVFTLRYQPPDTVTQLPDRWVIAGVRFEPQPVTPPQRPYCETVLARSAP